MFLIRRIFIMLVSLTSIGAFGQSTESNKAVNNNEGGKAPNIRIDVTPFTIAPEVPGVFRVPFRVSNNSNADLVLERFDARFLVPSGAHREAVTSVGGTERASNCKPPQISIPSNGEAFVICEFLPSISIDSPLDVVSMAFNWATLTVRPGDYQLFAVATLNELNDDGEVTATHSTNAVASIPLRPTVWQVVVGVGFGALLLAVFKVWSPNARHEIGLDSSKLSRLAGTGLFLRFWLAGWVAGAMLVFMTFRMKDVGFPISIAVNDFYGGIVIGIFSYIAAVWLVRKVLVDSTKNAIEKEA